MTMNPRDYDLAELDGDNEFNTGTGRSQRGHISADDVVRSNQYRELMQLESMTNNLEKPYLDAIPSTYSAEVIVFEWLEYLVGKAGFKGAFEAIRYYRTIDWITDDIEGILTDYLRSFDDATATDPDGLDRSDHQLSLVYLAKLTAMN